MKRLALVVVLVFAGCVYRSDPRLQAADEFRTSAFALIEKDEAAEKKLAALRLGMTDEEVIREAGAPSSRDTASGDEGEREVWTYSGELKSLGTLTFENRKLVKIDTF
jgi:hypothetical protein